MADDTLKIKVEYEVDDSKLNQSLGKIQSNTGKALSSGGTSPQTTIDRSLVQANKLQDRLKVLGEVHKSLASQPGMERSLAKVNQEMAGIFSQQKRMSNGVAEYISNLNKQVELQKQARNLMNNADGGSNQFSAHSQRQMAMLQQFTRGVPGGSIFNNFLSGAGRAAGGIEGEGAGLLSKAGLAGGGMAAGAAAAAAGLALVISKEMELAARSVELSQSAGSATSSLGQLRSQIERAAISKDIAAASPNAVSIAGIQSYLGQQVDSFVNHLFNSSQDRNKGVNEKISAGLGGDAGEQWRRQKEQGQDLNLDLARQKQALSIQQFRQDRDFALDLKQFAIDTANTRFDLQKQAQRQEQDYSIAKQQYDENFQGKMAARQFQLQKQYALADYNIQRQDKAYDFGVNVQRSVQDYGLQRADAKFDFSKSLNRNQSEFDINKSRQGQDFQETKLKMALSGASGQDWLFANMDFRKEQQRQQEDFTRQKKLATEDYITSTGRNDRNFQIGQNRNLADYSLSANRDARQFGITNQRMDTGRQLQIESELYARKYEGLGLEIAHNRNLQDASIALQRFTQATGMQQQRFANQAGDIKYDQGIQNQDFAISSYRSLRDFKYNQQDLAGAIRKSDPLGAYGQLLKDPDFAAAIAGNASATGQLDLGRQVQSTRGVGNVGGGFLGDPGGALGDLARLLTFGVDRDQGHLKDTSLKQPVINLGNRTFQMPNLPAGSGFNLDTFQDKIQQIIDKGDQDVMNKIMDEIKRVYGF
jgi:hypothetical protein